MFLLADNHLQGLVGFVCSQRRSACQDHAGNTGTLFPRHISHLFPGLWAHGWWASRDPAGDSQALGQLTLSRTESVQFLLFFNVGETHMAFNESFQNPQCCGTVVFIEVRNVSIPPQRHTTPISHPPPPRPLAPQTHFLPLWICLFWRFPTGGTTHCASCCVCLSH